MLAALVLLAAGLSTPTVSSNVVAFASDRDGNFELYVGALDGSWSRRLTYNDEHDQFPRCSPDGRRIAFVRGAREAREVYVLDFVTMEETRLTENSWPDYTPSWSPDGESLVFTRMVDGFDRLSLSSAQGGVVLDTGVHAWHDVMASYSPVGPSLVFHSYREGGGNVEIFERSLVNGQDRRLTNDPGRDFEAAVSPDGTRGAFSSNRGGGNFQLYEISLAAPEEATLLVETEFDAWGARYSQDGRAVLFYGGEKGRERLHVLSLGDGVVAVSPFFAVGGDWCHGAAALRGKVSQQ